MSASEGTRSGVHPIVRLYFWSRAVANLFLLMVASAAFPADAPKALWGALIVWSLVWPWFARWWAGVSPDPKGAERRNLLMDCVVLGAAAAYVDFQILPCLGFFLASFSMTTLTGGFPLLGKAMACNALGVLIVVAFTGFEPRWDSPLHVELIAVTGTLGYTVMIAFLTWRQTKILIALKVEMREKKAELEHLHQEVIEANEDLQDFSRIVAHDLKAPLRGVGILSNNLAKDYKDVLDDTGKKSLELMDARLKRMQNLIDGVLRYSRAAGGEMELSRVDLGNLVKDIAQVVGQGREVEFDLPDDLPEVITDSTRMEQVFQNLMSNAVKYLDKDPGKVLVSWSNSNGFYRFSITDNGPGIDPKYHQQVFEVFRTLQSRDQYESTGVGLSVVKKIVERWGGEIGVESRVGEGATFWFTLPVENEPNRVN